MTEWDPDQPGPGGEPPWGFDASPDPDVPEHDRDPAGGEHDPGPYAPESGDPYGPGDAYGPGDSRGPAGPYGPGSGAADQPGPAFPDEPAHLPAEADPDLPAADLWSADLSGPDAGADPSADPSADGTGPPDGTDPASWTDGTEPDPFPPALDLDVTPADGGPWTDPDLIGGTDDWSAAPLDPPSALLPDLAAADGDPTAGWQSLHDSDDPAVRALATHWHG